MTILAFRAALGELSRAVGSLVLRVVLPLLALHASSCISSQACGSGAITREFEWGRISAEDESTLMEVGLIATELVASYSSLPGFEPVPVHIVVGPEVIQDEHAGLSYEVPHGVRCVLLGGRAAVRDLVLAHELVHCYFSPTLDLLPGVVEEGVCDLLAAQALETHSRVEQRVAFALVAFCDPVRLDVQGAAMRAVASELLAADLPLSSVLDFSTHDLLSKSQVERLAYYGLGASIANRVGLEGLVALAEAANDERVEPSVLLKVADVVPSYPGSVQRALVELYVGGNVEEGGAAPIVRLLSADVPIEEL